jgi:hypothetical protein
MSVADAVQVGVSLSNIRRWVRGGVLERVGRGVYAAAATLEQADPWTEHAIRTRGFVRACRGGAFAAGLSAVAVRDVRRLGRPPARPIAVQPRPPDAGTARRRFGAAQSVFGVLRPVPLDSRHHSQHSGCPVVGSAWMVVDVARSAPPATALVIADAVLGAGTTVAGLRRALTTVQGWPGTAAAEWVVAHADGRSESALETLGRLSCIEAGLPVPVSNAWIGPGYPLYRVDHLWPWHWLVAEADGLLKYRDATDPAAVVAAEKEREWFLTRRLGVDVVRYGWDLAYGDRCELASRFRGVLAANPVRSAPVPWWPTDDPFAEPVRS